MHLFFSSTFFMYLQAPELISNSLGVEIFIQSSVMQLHGCWHTGSDQKHEK